MIILEFGRCRGARWWQCGRFRSTIGGKRYRRFWFPFAFLAVTWYDGDAHEFGRELASGGTEWRYSWESKEDERQRRRSEEATL